MSKAFKKFSNDNPMIGSNYINDYWDRIDNETFYKKVLNARVPSGFSNSSAIAAVRATIDQGHMEGVTLHKNTLKITGTFEGPKDLTNSLMGLAAGHRKRTEGSTLIIDLFEQL